MKIEVLAWRMRQAFSIGLLKIFSILQKVTIFFEGVMQEIKNITQRYIGMRMRCFDSALSGRETSSKARDFPVSEEDKVQSAVSVQKRK